MCHTSYLDYAGAAQPARVRAHRHDTPWHAMTCHDTGVAQPVRAHRRRVRARAARVGERRVRCAIVTGTTIPSRRAPCTRHDAP